MDSSAPPTVTRGSCHHDCPDTCSWDVTVSDGHAVQLRGTPNHPTTRGELCPKVNRFLDRVYHPDRLLTPLRRVGPKGSGEFAEIGWDEAISVVSERLSDVVEGHGAEAILQYSFAGTQGVVQMGILPDRFFDVLGASDIRRDLCGVTASLAAADVSGVPFGLDPEDLRLARMIILWGTNTLLTNRHLWPVIEEAREAGATVIVIDPVRTATAERVDVHIQPKPGTDVSLVVALVGVMDREGLLDEEWLATATTGWEDLLESARSVSLEDLAQETGVVPEQIEWLARSYAMNGPAAIRVLIGPEHRRNGREIMRSIAMLPALTGAWRDPGGGLARSTQVYFETALNYPERMPRRRFNMARLGSVLLDHDLDPPIHALFVHNSNPAVITPDQESVLEGLRRDDLFTVVVEQFMTDTARHADVIMPATTQIEHLDLGLSWGHLYLSLNRPAIAPRGQALPNTEIFRRLAAAMGLHDDILARDDESLVRSMLDSEHPWVEGITLETLSEKGWQRLRIPPGHRPNVDAAPSTSDGKLRLGSLNRAQSPRGEEYPLMLMSRKQHVRFLNANYGGFPAHQPASGGPVVHLHPDDAAERSIADGETVVVWNERGQLTLRALVADDVQPGLVTIPFGWWNQSTPEARSVNVLTDPSVPADDVGSAAFHDTRVEIRRVEGGGE